jgi:sugar phosphate isomerase/epimerase
VGKESDSVLKIAIEMHPGFVVYSPETMLKLRAIAGKSIGCNYDPSHMFWQAIDPIKAIRCLGDSIFHVHAKDTQIYDSNLPMTGVLDTKKYTDERNRAWILRARVHVVERVCFHSADVRVRLRVVD